MFIAQAFNYKHDFWRYIIGIIIVVASLFLGQIPLMVALLMELGVAETATLTESELMTSLDSNYFFFLLLLSYAVALGAVIFAAKKVHGQTLRSLTTSGLKK